MLVRDVEQLGDDLGHVRDRRQLVGVERLVERDPARRIEQAILRERVPDALDDSALDLARGAERVDDAADVVDRRDALDADLAGLDVDGDLGHLHAEGQHLHAGRVRARAPLPRICASSSRPTTSSIGQEPPSDETTLPPWSERTRSSLS